MSNVSKRRREGTRAKIKSMGDHKDFLKRITKSLYYGELPTLPCLSMPVTEISCELWSMAQRGRSLRRLHMDEAASMARSACVSPCALVLAILYLERLKSCNPDYLHSAEPSDLFLVSLMVSNKFLQDDGEDDEVVCSEWAASGNLDTKHLKRLEVQFLNAIDWKVFVSEAAFERGLRHLERAVALRQARLQGFFTYSDLAAAGCGRAPLAAAVACLALALGYLASLAALLAATTTTTTTTTTIKVHLPHYSNVTVPLPDLSELPAPGELLTVADEWTCCAQWQRHLAPPGRGWDDSVHPNDWAWSTMSVLHWLYQSWLDEPAPLGEASAPAEACPAGRGGGGRCVRQWLNLSKLSALMVTVSDR